MAKKKLPKYTWVVLAIAILVGIMIMTSAPEGTLAKFSAAKSIMPVVPTTYTDIFLMKGNSTVVNNNTITLTNVGPTAVLVRVGVDRAVPYIPSNTAVSFNAGVKIIVLSAFYSNTPSERSATLRVYY